MFDDFAFRHVPALLVGTAITFGGLMPFFNAAYAIEEFGLPQRIAVSGPAQSTFTLASGRVTALGLALFTFYVQKQYAAVDVIMAVLGYVGLVDGYICWKEGVPGKAVFRLASGLAIGACGFFGTTGV